MYISLPSIIPILFSICLILNIVSGQSSRKPTIRINPKDQGWDISIQNQRLICSATGYPPPSIRWFKNGQQIPGLTSSSTNRRWVNTIVKNGNVFSALTFKTLNKRDEGYYGCHAQNEYGTVPSKKASLVIYGPPMVIGVQPQLKSVSWDEEFQIPCNGKGPPPITHVTWYYKGISQASATPAVQGIWNVPLDSPSLKILPQKSEARRLHVVKYEVYCTVANKNGNSSSSTTLINIKRPPDRPVVLDIIPIRRGASINWKPGSNGYDNHKPLCYLNLIPDNGVNTTRGLEVEYPHATEHLLGLEALQEYAFEIRCRNSIGFSPWSRKNTFTTKEGYPDAAPEFIHAVPLNSTTLNISWSPIPRKNIHGILTGYSVKILEAENTRIQKLKNVTSGKDLQIFTKLEPGKKYYVRVAGYTRVKQGPWSRYVEVTMPLPKPPNTPIILNVTVDKRMASITFLHNKSDPQLISTCMIHVMNAGHRFTTKVVARENITLYSILGLFPFKHYSVKVMCSDLHGQSEWSDLVRFQTLEDVPNRAPSGFVVSETGDHFINVSWSAVSNDDMNGKFIGYKLCITHGDTGTNCLDGIEKKRYIYENTSPQSSYSFSVASCTDAGCGPFSKLESLFTSVWSTTGIIVTTIAQTTGTIEKTTEIPQEGLSPIIIICVIGIALLCVIIIIILCVCFRRRKSKHQAGDPSVRYIPGNEEDDHGYDEISPLTSNSTSLVLPSSVRDKLFDVKISRKRIQLCKVLGEGEFGCVYKAILKSADRREGSDERHVAVKTMKSDEFDASEREEFVKEGLRMKNLDHPNVMTLIGICLPEEERNSNDSHGHIRLSRDESISPLVVIPFMEMGDLRTHLFLARSSKETGSLTLHRLLNFALDIASGMEYLSQSNIIHRDLACRNCMLDSQFHVVVSDFGLSRQVYSSNYYRQRRVAKMPVKWMALESLVDRIYTSKTDIWSFGVTFWEIFTLCQNPYPGVANHEMHELLRAGTRLKQPPRCPKDVWFDSIYPCWEPQPDERPTFQELISMIENFLQEYPEDHNPGPTNSATGYVNVLPPSEYEIPISPLQKNDEVPMPYESAIEKNRSTKKNGTKNTSVKEPLLSSKRNEEFVVHL